jgi:hypothetical protein
MIALWCALTLAAPPTLADGLRKIGALDAVEAPAPLPPPDRTGPAIVLGLSGAALLTGLVGHLVPPGCETKDAQSRCVALGTNPSVFSSLIVLGLGGLTAGAWWYQQLPADQR